MTARNRFVERPRAVSGWGRFLWIACLLLGLGACVARAPGQADTLVIGDSVLTWHELGRASVADVLARESGRAVLSRAKPGARISASSPDKVAQGFDIRAQYVPGDWAWVVINGGANDLMSECGCRRCARVLDGLIGAGARDGDIPALVARAQSDADHVMLLGYYRANAQPNLFDACRDEIAILNARLAALAARSGARVHYRDAGAVIDPDNPAHWYIDRIHPSRLGARRIGAYLAQEMAVLDAGS